MSLMLQRAGVMAGGSGIPSSVRAVATRTGLPGTINATYPWVLAQTSHVLCSNVDGELELWWPNFYLPISGGTYGGVTEVAPGDAATATAQITYIDPDDGETTVDLLDKTGGTTALSASDGGWFKAVATIKANAGTRLRPRFRGNFPEGFLYHQFRADLGNGDRVQFGETVPSLATTPVNSFAAGQIWYGPALIAARSSAPAVFIIGDSLDAGTFDIPHDTYGDSGRFPRLFGRAEVAYINAAMGGEKAQEFAAATSRARRMELVAYATCAAIGLGTNDASARTGAQINGDVQSIIDDIDLPAIVSTLTPWTQDGLSAAFSGTFETNRGAYNTLARARSAYYDPPSVLENAGAWRSWDLFYPDYLHPSNVGNAYAAEHAAVVGATVGVFGIAARAAGTNKPNTNILTAPSDFSNGAWTKQRCTISSAGATNQQIREASDTEQTHEIFQVVAKAASAIRYRGVTDAAGVNRTWARMEFYNGAFSSGADRCYFNLDTGAAGTPSAYGSFSVPSLFSVALPDASGIAMVADFTSDTDDELYILLGPAEADNDKTYNGNTSNGIAAQNCRIYPIPTITEGLYSEPYPMDAPSLVGADTAIAVTRAAYTFAGAIDSYELRHSTDETNWTVVAMTTNPQNITGLTNGVEYFVQTRAVNTVGNGPWSESESATPAAVATVWDGAFKHADITLSGSDRVATISTGGNKSTRGTTAKSSGKYYLEIVKLAGNLGIGIGNSSHATTDWMGSSGNSTGVDTTVAGGTVYTSGSSQGSASLGTISNNDVIGVAFDLATRKVWFSRNGSFGTGDPAAGTGGFNAPASGDLYPLLTLYSNSASARINTTAAQQAHSPPSGFSRWD